MAFPIRRGRIWMLVAGIVVLALLAVIGYFYWKDEPDPAIVNKDGGIAWNADQTVGVRVAPGGVAKATRFTFSSPNRELPESPLAGKYQETIIPPVDIVPNGTVTNAEVIFKVDPAKLPTSPTGPDGKPQRSVHNAGIRVFNETLGFWADLPTQVENGNWLVAKAPHFSLFGVNAVTCLSPFVFALNVQECLRIFTDTVKTLGLALVETAVTLYKSIMGEFDESKFDCSKQSDQYKIDKHEEWASKDRMGACVVKRDGQSDLLLLKNSLAIPYKFYAGGAKGVSASLSAGEIDLKSLGLNLVGLITGDAFVSGLEVGGFDLVQPPDNFTVKGEESWVAWIVDLVMVALTMFLPQTKVITTTMRAVFVKVQERLLAVITKEGLVKVDFQRVTQILELVIKEEKTEPSIFNQVFAVIEGVNCALSAGQNLRINDLPSLPGALADLVQKCLMSALVDKIKVPEFSDMAKGIGEVAKEIAKEAKILQAIPQSVGTKFLSMMSGKDASGVTFDVRRVNPVLEPFVGSWGGGCVDSGEDFDVFADYSGRWKIYTVAGIDSETIQLEATFHLEEENGTPVLVIDRVIHAFETPENKRRISLRKNGSVLAIHSKDGSEHLVFESGYGNASGTCPGQ